MHDLILENTKLVLPDKIETHDIAITDGRVSAIGSLSTEESKERRNLNGLTVFPGMIDTQVHFRDPGHPEKETLKSGSAAAAMGGVTGFFEMPNTNPTTTDEASFQAKIANASKNSYVDFAFYIGANGANTMELEALTNLPGCCGVKIFMGSSTGSLLVNDEDTLEEIFKNVKKRIALHCEDEERLNLRKSIRDQYTTAHGHPIWRDEMTAYIATEKAINLAKKVNRQVHVLHITSQKEIEFLAKNKDHCTVEVLPQHLTLTAPECYDTHGTAAQMNPPIREANHQAALWEGIKNGTVDILGSDHAPHTKAEKDQGYPNTPSGIPGVQTIIPLMLNHINEGRLSPHKLLELMALNPARIFKMPDFGAIEIGKRANLTVVDMNKSFEITEDWLVSKAPSPFLGKVIKGKPELTIIGGKVVMENNQLNQTKAASNIEFR